MNYYVFNDEETAINAEAYISQIADFPRESTDFTGLPKLQAQMTTIWANVQQRNDEKWVFPCVPEEIVQNYPQELVEYFNLNFPHSVENLNAEWFTVVE